MSDHLERLEAMLTRLDEYADGARCEQGHACVQLGEIELVAAQCSDGHRLSIGAGDATGEDLRAALRDLGQLRGADAEAASETNIANYGRWLHRQLRAAYRAGHADAREEIRRAIVTSHGDTEQAAARWVEAWNAAALQQSEPCDGECDCDCQPGQPCLCPERDCYCGPCPVCDRDEGTQQPKRDPFVDLASRTHLNYIPTSDEQQAEPDRREQ